MNQNFIKIIFVNQSEKIEKPKSLNEFKEKISNLFNINHNDLKNIIIKMKSPIDVFLENNNVYNDMVRFANLSDIVIEIKIKKSNNNNNNNNNIYNLNNQMNNLNINSIQEDSTYIKNYYQQYYPEPIEIDEDYSCVFYEDKKTLKIKLSDLRRNDNRVKYTFKLQNNGQRPWPDDTYLKCVNDDSDIFFYHCLIGPVKWIDNIVYNEFEIIINFKNDYPNVGNYQCHAILMSDSKGQMGKSVGTLNIKIY